MTYQRVKRGFDIVGALIGLVVFGPLLVATALVAFLLQGAPILFTQDRVTAGNRVFRLLKFRSMRPAAPGPGREAGDGVRLTAFGRFIRATSIDELPSLINVLRGDLSLIGPRPLTTDYLPLYTPAQLRRHEVRAGLSGLAQVSGRNALSWDEKFDLDVSYVESLGFATDTGILLRTFAAVLGRKGVSRPGEATTDSYGGSLRSDSVVFEQIARTRDLVQWMATTRAGQRIGLCEMTTSAGAARTIRFVANPPNPDFDVEQTAEFGREVIRLLVNRARGSDADVALCSVSAADSEARLYVDSGFRPLSQEPRAAHFAAAYGGTDSGDLLCCLLWPDELTSDDVELAS